MTRGGQFCMEVVDYSAVCGGIGVRGFVESLDFKENLAFFERFVGGEDLKGTSKFEEPLLFTNSPFSRISKFLSTAWSSLITLYFIERKTCFEKKTGRNICPSPILFPLQDTKLRLSRGWGWARDLSKADSACVAGAAKRDVGDFSGWQKVKQNQEIVGKKIFTDAIPVLILCLVNPWYFYGLFHGKSPLDHHLGNSFFIFPTTKEANQSNWMLNGFWEQRLEVTETTFRKHIHWIRRKEVLESRGLGPIQSPNKCREDQGHQKTRAVRTYLSSHSGCRDAYP